jgi:hypothetical protein
MSLDATPSEAGKIENFEEKKLIHLIGTRTCDLPACSVMPQLLHYRAPRGSCLNVILSLDI